MTIVNNIKKYRTDRGMTQKQLAEQVGCGQSRIADYEAGRYKTENITLGFALRVAEALQCSVEELFAANHDEENSK